MDNTVLDTALVPEKDWDSCFVDDDGNIYTPRYDHKTGQMTETGREVYERIHGQLMQT